MRFVSLVAIALGLLLALLLRRAYKNRTGRHPARCLNNVDLAAFQNLIRSSDDLCLRESLPRKSYRVAKRARVRAIQRYLLWIANDCTIIQSLVSSSECRGVEDERVRQELSKTAFNLRLASVLLWSRLWLEWVFPNLDLAPESMLTTYEKSMKQMRSRFAQLSPAKSG